MPADLTPLTTPQIETHLAAWLDHIGRLNGQRLRDLTAVFLDGPAPLAAALAVVAPGKNRPAALAAYQTFANRINEAAKDAGLALVLRVDTKKQTDPADRRTWIEGPSPDVASLAQFTREAVSTVERQEQLIPPMAVILTSDEIREARPAKPLIRFFVSYAHHDRDKVIRLQNPLEKELQLSKRFQFEIWHDRKIEVGAKWDQEIQDALATCHFGLLFVSRDFLVSQYISEKELPLFLRGEKPVIPVGLAPLRIGEVDMKGLEERQIFRLTPEKGEPRFFTECAGKTADRFVMELASEIRRKVAAAWDEAQARREADTGARGRIPRASGKMPALPKIGSAHPDDPDDHRVGRASRLPRPASSRTESPWSSHVPDDDEDDPIPDFAHTIIEGTTRPAHLVPPDAAPTSFTTWEKDASVLTQNRTLAVEYLANWATDPDGSPFCAVLGEVGIGKTTTLMLLAGELDLRRASDPTIPPVIFIDLKDYHFDGEPKLDDILREVIARHWKGGGGRAITPAMIQRAVQERGALIIFDGLDEIIIPMPPARRDAFISELWRILPPLTHRPQPGKPSNARPGKLIISCRSHYFPSVTALSSAFTGRGREGIHQKDYTACVVLPFSEDQVRSYLAQMLGPDRVEEALGIIRSVHNLEELSARPMLLGLIAPELAELERLKKAGRIVLGVTLYGLFVDRWLARDNGKHVFLPEHKLRMMEALAAHLATLNEKTLPWEKVSRWLDTFLAAHPDIRGRYTDKAAEALNADFRTATLCLRPDGEKDGFRFAHTSLYEYFLALHLMRALEENRPAAWDQPLPSDETLNFAGQLLAAGDKVNRAATLAAWSRFMDDPDAPAQARRNALRAWNLANNKGWPVPDPHAPQLHHLDLETWTLGSETAPPLDLRGANLDGTVLDHAVLHRVLLSGANANGVSARLMEMHGCVLNDSTWENANLTGGTWRDCEARGLKANTAEWHDCDVIRCDLQDAGLPSAWASKASSDSQTTSTYPTVVFLQLGHPGFVEGVAWSPDGRAIAIGSSNYLRVCDARSGRCLLILKGHDNGVTGVAWSPDGSRILSGSYDRTVKLWNAENGECLLTMEGHASYVNDVAWSPDGLRVVSGGEDKTVKIWDPETGHVLFNLKGHTDSIASVAWSPDGMCVLSGSSDKTVKVWDLTSKCCLLTLKGHRQGVTGVAWSPDGSLIVSGSYDKTMKVWNAASGRCLSTLCGHSKAVLDVAWTRDGTQILSGGQDAMLKVWDAPTGRCLRTLVGHPYAVDSVEWSPDGTRALSGSDQTVKVWDVTSGRCALTIGKGQVEIQTVAWSPEGARLLSGSNDHTIKVWDATSGRRLLTLNGHVDHVTSVTWSPNGAFILSGSWDGTVKIWETTNGSCLLTLDVNTDTPFVAWSANGNRAVSACSDKNLFVWDTTSGHRLFTLKGHRETIGCVAWSPDGVRIASGSGDHTVKLWDAATGRCLLTLKGHQHWIGSVAWSPDGRMRLASGSSDETVKVWDAATGCCLLTLEGHSNGVGSVVWSPDGARIASGSWDQQVKVWDTTTGLCLLTLRGCQQDVTSVAWSPNGNHILSSSEDGTICEWDASTGRLLRTWVIGGDEAALVDFPGNRILHATPGAWRLLGWQGYDPVAKRRRLLPAEAFGPLPPW